MIPSDGEPLQRAVDICYRCQRDVCGYCLGENDRWYQICWQCHGEEGWINECGERLYDYPLRPINLARKRKVVQRRADTAKARRAARRHPEKWISLQWISLLGTGPTTTD